MDFKLRPWTMADVEILPRHASNFNIAKFMTDRFPHPYTTDDAKAFIEMATQDDPIHIFAIDINGQGVGGIGIHPQQDVFKKNAELGYWLAEPFWRQALLQKR
jgi:ribosomal-protein-alanine N-acetyltransferase